MDLQHLYCEKQIEKGYKHMGLLVLVPIHVGGRPWKQTQFTLPFNHDGALCSLPFSPITIGGRQFHQQPF